MIDSLKELRAILRKEKLSGFILPVNDEFMGEYVPDSAKRLAWLTGFTGSAGMVVVLEQKAAFFTDGRYTLQAKTEVSEDFELYNSGDMPPEKWIYEQPTQRAVIGYDPKLHTLQSLKRYEAATPGVTWRPMTPNPIDALWEDRPAAPSSSVRIHPLKYAGESLADKRGRVSRAIAVKGADAVILTAPDSICWLLNIRGSDVPFTPFVLCYAILTSTGVVMLYVDEERIPKKVETHLGVEVIIKSPETLAEDLKTFERQRVMYDPTSSPVWFYQQLAEAGAEIIESADPCLLPKACKNEVEQKGMRAAHQRDGLAVTRFLCWLDGALTNKDKLTEMDVAAKLESFRKQSELYLEPSFTTISGSGPNGAIVHYRVTEASNRTLDNNSLLLVDSGGQYADGTTDITRTIALGQPTPEMKDRFTRVLKGHIALARAVFPEGTTGAQLDTLARQYLWDMGLDYDHGTGHGVGSYLSVHEGPQGISKRAGGVALTPGMIISNEPGYYKTDEYGIRMESLVMVKEVATPVRGTKKFLGFETITMAPIDMRIVDKTLLTLQESKWLAQYHQKVYDTHAEYLNEDEIRWMKMNLLYLTILLHSAK